MSYLLVLTESRFFLYYLTEDATSAADVELVMEVDFRFDRKMRQYGKIVSGCFSDDGFYFVTVSFTGMLMLWNIKEKRMVKQAPIDMNKQFEAAGYLHIAKK